MKIKRRQFNPKILTGAFLSLFLLGGGWLVTMMSVRFEKPLSQTAVVFVFSGSAEYLARTRKAAAVFHEGRATKIILTNDSVAAGWSEADERNPFYWELARRELLQQNVQSEAIEILPEPVASTHDEAVLLAKNIKEQNWQAVLLVTSPSHTRRAWWTAERVCRQAGVAVELGIEAAESNEETLFDYCSSAINEPLKFAYYWLFY